MEEESVRARLPRSLPFKPARGLTKEWGQGGSDTSDEDGAESSSAVSSDVFSLHGDQSKSSFQVLSFLVFLLLLLCVFTQLCLACACVSLFSNTHQSVAHVLFVHLSLCSLSHALALLFSMVSLSCCSAFSQASLTCMIMLLVPRPAPFSPSPLLTFPSPNCRG